MSIIKTLKNLSYFFLTFLGAFPIKQAIFFVNKKNLFQDVEDITLWAEYF